MLFFHHPKHLTLFATRQLIDSIPKHQYLHVIKMAPGWPRETHPSAHSNPNVRATTRHEHVMLRWERGSVWWRDGRENQVIPVLWREMDLET